MIRVQGLVKAFAAAAVLVVILAIPARANAGRDAEAGCLGAEVVGSSIGHSSPSSADDRMELVVFPGQVTTHDHVVAYRNRCEHVVEAVLIAGEHQGALNDLRIELWLGEPSVLSPLNATVAKRATSLVVGVGASGLAPHDTSVGIAVFGPGEVAHLTASVIAGPEREADTDIVVRWALAERQR